MTGPLQPNVSVMSATVSALSGADETRRAGLRRMRVVATGLLVLAAIIYLLTLGRETHSVLGYVNATAGAAMVGALADWFAVTALFRHPLGVPVPHTALVPRRKGELGRSLQDFVLEHFLTERVARDRVGQMQVVLRVGQWLDRPEHRRTVLDEVVRMGRAALGRIKDDQVKHLVEQVVAPRLVKEPFAKLTGDLLDAVIRDKSHYGLVDLALSEVHGWLKENPDRFISVVAERAPWWSPSWVDDKVVNWTYQQALAWVSDIQGDRNHQTRRALDDMLLRLAADLQTDPDTQARAEALKERLLTHPQVGVTAVSLWQSARRQLLAMMDDDTSGLYLRGDRYLAEFGSRLQTDDALRARLDELVGDAVGFVVRNYGEELAGAISHTIDQWDGRDASDRIELHVGRDLQFIRINGTVVGALAGFLIHVVGHLVSG